MSGQCVHCWLLCWQCGLCCSTMIHLLRGEQGRRAPRPLPRRVHTVILEQAASSALLFPVVTLVIPFRMRLTLVLRRSTLSLSESGCMAWGVGALPSATHGSMGPPASFSPLSAL